MNTKQFIDAIEKTYADSLAIVKAKNRDYAIKLYRDKIYK